MTIIFKDYTPIFRFIEENKARYSEAQMAAIVGTQLDTEFASEPIVDNLMWQAKPDTMLGEWLIEEFGNIETAQRMVSLLDQSLRRSRDNNILGD